MIKRWMKRLEICLLTWAMLLPLLAVSTQAETPKSDITMVVSSSCYVYTTSSTSTKNRAAYVTFGQEIQVITLESTWAKIQYQGRSLYVQSKNLEYKTSTIVKNRIMISPGAYACSASSTLGYGYYGTKVAVLGEAVTKKGVRYIHCIVPEAYSSDGSQILGTQVEGYINAAYLSETATPKIVNQETELYASAFGASSPDSAKGAVGSITAGEHVQMLMSNKTWSKIRYNGQVYYMSTSHLDPWKIQIMVNRAAQTVDAKPGSGFQHYVYWNESITVLNTYESDTYGTYFYCKVGNDYGFVREFSSAGLQYVGYNTSMLTKESTPMYQKASTEAAVMDQIPQGTAVIAEYTSSGWVRVSYQGNTGFIQAGQLIYPEYTAAGSYYNTAYRMYKKTANGTLKETVFLSAKNDKYGYAYVIDQAGNGRFMRTTALKPTAPAEQEKVRYTALPSVTLHTKPNNDSDIIAVPYMTKLILQGTVSESASGSWVKVLYENQTMYLWLPQGETLLVETKSSFSYQGNTEYQQRVIDEALRISREWDVKYAHGQSNGQVDTDGKYGFDCSGFASYVLNQVMQSTVPTYRVSANLQNLFEVTDIYNQGYTGAFAAQTVSMENLQPGDVIFFNLSEEAEAEQQNVQCNHCGIYLGNGEFIHCTHSWGGKVIIMPFSEWYQQGFVTAKRFLPETVTAAEKTMYTTSQKTSVYSAKDSDTEPLVVLGAEIPVILEYTDNGNWAYVRMENGEHGYILLKYLSEGEQQESKTRYIASTSLKLYAQPKTSSDSVEVLIGTAVEYVGRYSNSSYYKVMYEGMLRYIYAPNGIEARLTEDYDGLMSGTAEKVVLTNTKLRSSMSSSSDQNMIRMVYKGEQATIIAVSDSGTWSYVRMADGQYGFLLSNKL